MEDLTTTTLDAFKLLLTGDKELWIIVATSFSVSLRAIVFATPVALLVAFVLATYRFAGRRLVVMVFHTLQAFPAVVVGLTVYILLSRQGPLGDWRLLFTQTSMIVGQILLGLPLLVAMTHAALEASDKRIWETARTLGASQGRAALTLMYQLRMPILVALIAAFSRIIAEVGSSIMVGGNILHHTRNIPTAIALETSKGEYAQGIALGIVLILLAFMFNAIIHMTQQRSRWATT
ncbi:MAG: ABC transporter permease [Gammaproteobacteria bacterium]|jgi:tungstate transport system permease protein